MDHFHRNKEDLDTIATGSLDGISEALDQFNIDTEIINLNIDKKYIQTLNGIIQ